MQEVIKLQKKLLSELNDLQNEPNDFDHQKAQQILETLRLCKAIIVDGDNCNAYIDLQVKAKSVEEKRNLMYVEIINANKQIKEYIIDAFRAMKSMFNNIDYNVTKLTNKP